MTLSEQSNERIPRVVVIGVGNLLMKDEGIGIHVIQHLQTIDLPDDVKLVDGGTSPDIIAYTRTNEKLIIVDSAKAGGEPGTVYRFRPEDLDAGGGDLASAHEMGVAPNLKLMEMSGSLPGETVIIGIEPKEISLGMDLTPELEARLPVIADVVLREIGSVKT